MARGVEDMISKAEALLNTFETLRVHRMIHKHEPAFIRVRCGDAGVVEIDSGWSKSATQGGRFPAFLILPQSDDVAAKLPSARLVEWGELNFIVTKCTAPTEPGSYWTLAVRGA
jgi:hypothetical protein